MKEHYADKIPK